MRNPYAVRRPVENEYLVRERDRRLVRDLLRVAVTVLLLGAGLLGYTWIHIETTAVGYRIDALEKELHQLEQEHRRLRLEATYRSRPARVDSISPWRSKIFSTPAPTVPRPATPMRRGGRAALSGFAVISRSFRAGGAVTGVGRGGSVSRDRKGRRARRRPGTQSASCE